jgi:hypothetical protein
MRFSTTFQRVVVMLALVGISAPQVGYAANGPQPHTPPVQDVALNAQGQLAGQLLNASGQAVPNTKIEVQQNGKLVAISQTSPRGLFVVDRLKAGIYQIHSDQTARVYRVWTADAAPPAAESQVLLVNDGRVVRGKGSNAKNLLLIGGLIITAGVIGGVIGYNIRDVDDAS